jgi:hypothetical protein
MNDLKNIMKNIATIIAAVKNWNASQVEAQCQAGQIRTVYMKRPVLVTKAAPWEVFKVSAFQLQCGIEYARRAIVKKAKAEGTSGTLTRPDYAKRIPGFLSVMVNRKDAEGMNGEAKQANPVHYLCGGLVKDRHLGTHLVDKQGNPLSKLEVLPFLYAAEVREDVPLWTRIKFANLIKFK